MIGRKVSVIDEFDELIEKVSRKYYMIGYIEGYIKAFIEGYRESVNAMVMRMLADGTLTISQIAKYTELSIEEIENIKRQSKLRYLFSFTS